MAVPGLMSNTCMYPWSPVLSAPMRPFCQFNHSKMTTVFLFRRRARMQSSEADFAGSEGLPKAQGAQQSVHLMQRHFNSRG